MFKRTVIYVAALEFAPVKWVLWGLLIVITLALSLGKEHTFVYLIFIVVFNRVPPEEAQVTN